MSKDTLTKAAKAAKKKEPKIHLAKYFNEETETPDFFRPMLESQLGSEMHTRREWKELIKKELNRNY